MPRRSCDGAGILDALRAAVANLEAHEAEVNALNVYPVPDGDTGSNMLATVRWALQSAEGGTDMAADRVAGAISAGALMGARGNSGVIASQIFRGMAEGLAGKRHFNGLDLAHSLSMGSATAYKAVGKPVEGTILTVIHDAAAAAVAAAEVDPDIEAVMAATVEAAERSVARTPSLLPILRENGVVDSGGQGLFRLFEGALHSIRAAAPRPTPAKAAPARTSAVTGQPSVILAHADEGFGYESLFHVSAQIRPLDVDAIRSHLESIGESVLVVGDGRSIKVHVHNERPDEVMAYAFSLGQVSQFTVENLDVQARDAREQRAMEFTRGTGPEAETAGAAHAAAPGLPTAGAIAGDGGGVHPVPSLAVVAVAAGDGIAAVFGEFGGVAIVQGGQSNNPSTGELLAAVHRLNADEVLILPNNPNVIMAARQVAELAERPVGVVPTRNAAEGIAAMMELDASLGLAANVELMTLAGRSIQSIQVTEAVRDATVGGRKVKKGQTIVLDPDDGLVAVDADREKAVVRAIRRFEPGYELVSVYYGDGADLAEAEGLARRLGEVRPDVEVEVHHGGQPHYRYLISAE